MESILWLIGGIVVITLAFRFFASFLWLFVLGYIIFVIYRAIKVNFMTEDSKSYSNHSSDTKNKDIIEAEYTVKEDRIDE